jgi:hypothetical protein
MRFENENRLYLVLAIYRIARKSPAVDNSDEGVAHWQFNSPDLQSPVAGQICIHYADFLVASIACRN